MIIDRSFRDLIDVAESKCHGWQTKTIFKVFTCTWKTYNAINYVDAKNCYKIITCDPLDDTVDQFSNIISGVAARLAKTDYSTREYEKFYDSIRYLYNFERTLYNKLTPRERDNLHNKLLLSIANIEEEVDRRRQNDLLELMYAEIVEEHKTMFESHGDIVEDDLEFGKQVSNGPANTENLLTNSSRMSTVSRASRVSMGISKAEPMEKGPFYDLVHLLVIVLSDLSAGTMLLSDVLGINRKPTFEDFKLFLQTLEVYGAGYEDDIDVNNYKRRETQSHSEAAIYYLERVIKLYDITLLSFKLQRNGSIVGKLPEQNKQIQGFLKF